MSLQQQLYDELAKTINLTGSQRFLLATTPQEWDWPVSEYTEMAEYQLVGYMPEAVPDHKPYYTRTSTSIYDAYKTVIRAVDVVTSDNQQQAVRDIDNRIKAANAKYSKKETILNHKMSEASKRAGKDFDEDKWLKGSGKRFQMELKSADAELEQLYADREEITNEWDTQRKEAIDALKLPKDDKSKLGFTNIVVGDNVEPFPGYMVSKNGLEWASEVRVDRAGQSKTISISSSSTKYSESENKIGVDGGVKVFFMKVFNAKGEDEKLNLDEDSSSTKITITFKALTTVSVNPHEGWFKSGYLKKIAQDDRWKERNQTKETMFGRKGILHSVISGFVAGYQPSLKIETSGSAYKKMKEALKGSAGISIPPFSFGSWSGISGDASATGSHSKEIWSTTKEDDAIIIESTTTAAQIIGVLVDHPFEV